MENAAANAAAVLRDARSGLQAHDSAENRRFFAEVFGWMTGGLALTGAVAAYIGVNPILAPMILRDQVLFFGLLGVELLMVVGLVWLVNRLSASAAAGLFLFYSALNGVTMSVIFLAYAQSTIASAFFVTAGTFAVMSAYGYATQTDLTRVGNLCLMALIGIIIASVVNFFLHSRALGWATTYIGVLVFVGLTAYDTQKIRQMELIAVPGSDQERKEAVLGALTLYLDFINLFLDILRIMGRRK